MSARLSGKVCVVTGTGGSIGRATALTFAREGASVVGSDVSVDAAQATLDADESSYVTSADIFVDSGMKAW